MDNILDNKWADKKKGIVPLPRRKDSEPVTSGRTGASPKPFLGLPFNGIAPVAVPAPKQQKLRRVKPNSFSGQQGPAAGAAAEPSSTLLPELAPSPMDDASGDESLAPPSPHGQNSTASPTPRTSEIPASLARRYVPLAELRGVPVAAKGLSILGPHQTIPDPPPMESPSIAKLNKEYNDVMQKVKNQKRLPHERDTSPRRARVNSAGSSRRTGQASSTPQLRQTDDGGFVLQPQSALLPEVKEATSEAEGDSEYNPGEPETDAAVSGAVTARRTGRIRVVVRKRPVREGETGEDCVQVSPPVVHIGAVKQRVDLSEYRENHDYQFDDAFGEMHNNEAVYHSCGRSLIDTVFEGGAASCFAYGQTGSGKTYTMIGSEREMGMYAMAATDIFERLQPEHHVFVSLYEIYCNSLFDLLNYRTVVVAREDANKKVNICGLTWHEISSVDDLRDVIDRGTVQRRTGSTSANEFSSRSHAILTITLRDESRPRFCGSLNIVDLAGSERAADTAATDKQTRLEGAEINKSLLALKECIRGLDERKRHIPFRGSKLTEVLRDSFLGNCRTIMVATISPTTDSVEHTLNTLRYAFRVKGLTIAMVDPSKERNAPRPTPAPRTKSVDPQPLAALYGGAAGAAAAVGGNGVPLLPPIRERRKKKSREKHRRGAGGETTPRVPMEQIDAMEKGLKSEIQVLRDEMTRIAQEKDQNINLLVQQNNKLERELKMMRKLLMNAQKVELVDVDSAVDSEPPASPDAYEDD